MLLFAAWTYLSTTFSTKNQATKQCLGLGWLFRISPFLTKGPFTNDVTSFFSIFNPLPLCHSSSLFFSNPTLLMTSLFGTKYTPFSHLDIYMHYIGFNYPFIRKNIVNYILINYIIF